MTATWAVAHRGTRRPHPLAALPDDRQGKHTPSVLTDAALGALAVCLTQSPSLNLVALLCQTVLGWVEQTSHRVRQALAARHTVLQDRQALTRYRLLESWDQLRACRLQGLERASPPDAS